MVSYFDSESSNVSKLLIVVIALSGPLFLWIGIAAAARRSLFTLHSMFRVLTVWHWIMAIIGAALVLGNYQQPLARYGFGALLFSFGLIWPEQWLKRQMAPPASPIPRKLN